MKHRIASIALALGLSVFALAPAARADVAPPESCGGKSAGEACNNAGGASFGHAGTCVDGMCPHASPGPDGGIVQEPYPCVLCSKSAGAGGTTTTGTTTGTSTTTTTGTTTVGTTTAAPADDDSSGGCGVRREGSAGAGLAGLLLAAGAIALARSRRR
jgi:hypothetical protein